MAKEIRAGVELTLKDGYSAGIRKAGSETGKFADKTLGVINDVDKALSGAGAKLAAFGLSFSLGAVTKDIIELDHRMARVGLTANASVEQIAALKRAVFEAAKSPDIKIDPTEVVSALETIMAKTGDLKFVGANIRNIALAIQAAGEAGGPMGDVFSEFAKNGYSAEQISRLMDDMIAQSDQGEFTFAEFAKNAKAVLSAYSAIGNTPDDVRRANAAMQVLTAGTKSAEVATTVLNSAINELRDPRKRDEIEKLGIKVRDLETGKLRDFNSIMLELAEASNDIYKADIINALFGSETIKAISAYNSEFAKKIDGLLELGDTAGKLSEKSATMAKTLQSNIQGLKTSFYEFADSNLTAPLAKITELLDDLTAHPERVKRLFTEIALGLGAITAVKGIAGVARIIESMKGLKSGKINITESLSMAGAMPVYVTNWGGGAGLGAGTGNTFTGTGAAPAGAGGLVEHYGNPLPPSARPPLPDQPASVWKGRLPSAKTSAATAAGVQAVISVVGLATELYDLSKNETLSDEERTKRKNGAVGDAFGSVAGAAGGAFLGTLIFPGVGTVIGGMIGSQLGGTGGRWAGETLGAWKDRTQRDLDAAQKDYEEALKEAANAVGKTTGEIRNAERKVIEAGARLEKAKEANEAKKAEDEKKKRAHEERMNAWAGGYSRTGGPAPAAYGGYTWHNNYMPSDLTSRRRVDDLIVTPRGQFSTHPEDYIFAMKNPETLVTAGIMAAGSRNQTFRGTPGVIQNNSNGISTRTVNDLIVTPRGQFNIHPDDYILAMKNPAALVNAAMPGEIRNEVRTVERVPQAVPPVTVDGEIRLYSELVIDDKGYRLRQAVGKNTTPYKFAVGSAKDARLIQ
jgi:hypothetical protein